MRFQTYITETPQIVDLRKKYDEMAKVKDGKLYRKGVIIQVWWDKDSMGRKFKGAKGRETWTSTDLKSAKREFKDMRDRFNENT